jgi:hypothetical protein
MIMIKKIGLGIEFLQLESSREWTRNLYNRMDIEYTELALYAAEILELYNLDYHVEYYRPYWMETQMEKLDTNIYKEIERYIYKKIRLPVVII